MKKLKYILFITLIVLVSCKGKEGGDGDGGVDPPPPAPAPKAATLNAPANNSECLDGENVEFKWAASENTDTYEIFIKNLLTQSEQSQTTTSTSVTINLTKGQPYSWYIISKSNTSTETAQSAKWKFYLKSEPVANYSPFPADLVSPKSEATVNAGSIKFEWSGSDADSGDTLTFDIYVDSSNPPTTRIKANHNSSSINHPINDSGTYYWKIITKDNSGSNSDSGVSKFKVVN
tara:strand:- start:186 stop:884 length:699 start_codon:yes stop_codon:yes gene_type:complete